MIEPADAGTRRIVMTRNGTEALSITDEGFGIGALTVGMPLGTEPANVGPTANFAGHTGIAWDDLSAMVDTYVITTAMANAQAESIVLPDFAGNNTTYKVFRKINARVMISVNSTTPVLITDSRFGSLIVQQSTKVRSHWNVCTRAPCRTGDTAFTAAQLYDGTESTPPTTASLNGATTWGAGANQITVSSDGIFTDACYRCGTTEAELIAYRDNVMGNTDICFVGMRCKVRLMEIWGHDHVWFPWDAARTTANPPTTHYDVVKINSCRGLELINCRFDQWPILTADHVNLTKNNHFKGPHWGKNPNNPDWPCRRPIAGTRHIGTAGVISNQVGAEVGTVAAATASTVTLQVGLASSENGFYVGKLLKITSGTGSGQQSTITAYNAGTRVVTLSTAFGIIPTTTSKYSIGLGAKNVLVSGCRFDGAVNDSFQFGNGSLGTGIHKVITIVNNDFMNGVIDQDPAYPVPEGDYLLGGTPAAGDVDKWHWKTTGPLANRDNNGNVVPSPRANMIDSDAFDPI